MRREKGRGQKRDRKSGRFDAGRQEGRDIYKIKAAASRTGMRLLWDAGGIWMRDAEKRYLLYELHTHQQTLRRCQAGRWIAYGVDRTKFLHNVTKE